MSTYFQTTEEAAKGRKWWVVDASGIPVGRLASAVATLIRGKHRPTFTPHVNGGDHVIVINADKVTLTGNKRETKMYRHHTGFIGGLKERKAGDLLEKNPARAIESAVSGMLPAGVLGHRIMGNLKVYTGAEHNHQAQTPQEFKVEVKKRK